MDCPQHKIVSLLGNMNFDGSASAYNVIIRMADRVNATHYPMPLPVFARSSEERTLLHGLEPVHNILELSAQADVTFVGVGNMDETAPLYVDGFIDLTELNDLTAAGAVGEITSWVYDRDGRLIEGLTNSRVASAPLEPAESRTVIGIAAGELKVPASPAPCAAVS